MCFRMSRTLWFRLTQNTHVRTKKMHLNIFTYILCHATIQEHNVDKRLMTTHWWSYRTPNIQLHGLLTTPSPWKITWPSKSFFTYFSWKDKQRSHSKYHLLAMRFRNYLYCVGLGIKLLLTHSALAILLSTFSHRREPVLKIHKYLYYLWVHLHLITSRLGHLVTL